MKGHVFLHANAFYFCKESTMAQSQERLTPGNVVEILDLNFPNYPKNGTLGRIVGIDGDEVTLNLPVKTGGEEVVTRHNKMGLRPADLKTAPLLQLRELGLSFDEMTRMIGESQQI
jgi:hypothetical protein